MKHTKLIALMLVALTAFATLAACNKDDNSSAAGTSAVSETASGSTSTESTVSEVTETNPLDAFETQNLDRTVTFLVEGDYLNGYKSVEIVENEDSTISEYVAERNRQVEAKLGIKIAELRTTAYGDMATRLRTAAQSGTSDFDIAMPFMTDAGPLISEGLFYNLNDYAEQLHLSESYWDQNANKSLSLGGKLYFTTGDFSMLSMDVTHCMIFNRQVVEDKALESPYTLVAEGKWTLDKMMELAHQVTTDSTGDGSMTWQDTWGLYINANYANSLFIGSGMSYASKDSDDIPYLSIYSDAATTVVSKIVDIFSSGDSIYVEGFNSEAQAAGFTNCYYATRDQLANGKALFATISLSDILNMAEYDAQFGLLVTPKLNEDQDEYRSYISVIFATSVVIPTSNSDPETAATVLGCLAAASTDTVKKNYYEKVLKIQKTTDEESAKMLDTIFDNRVYDLGAIYNWGSLRDAISSIATSGQNTFASWYDMNKDAIEAAMDLTLNSLN